MNEQSEVEVRRSARRKRTVSAYRQDGKLIVLMPASFTRAEELHWVEKMAAKVDRNARRTRGSDTQLMNRARELSEQYLDGQATPKSIRWVDTMTTRWASCSTGSREIRVSDRLQAMPEWVLDYVVFHELAHLIEPSHSAYFWQLVDRYPKAERAKGYLEGVTAAGTRG
ncbi:MAG TPA: M48 family metallopeptidase [Marmoricola sp.]|nr:M48 family metallopeptidase [Marmoricola sp.]